MNDVKTVSATPLVDPVSTVASLTEVIRDGCGDMDTTRTVPTPVIRALQEAGIFRLMAPLAARGTSAA